MIHPKASELFNNREFMNKFIPLVCTYRMYKTPKTLQTTFGNTVQTVQHRDPIKNVIELLELLQEYEVCNSTVTQIMGNMKSLILEHIEIDDLLSTPQGTQLKFEIGEDIYLYTPFELMVK